MTTPVYGWVKPTVGGSTNVWGTTLNTLFDDIDFDLDAVDDRLDIAETNITTALANAGSVTGKTVAETAFVTNEDVTVALLSGVTTITNVSVNGRVQIPVTLANGCVLTSVNLHCQPTTGTVSVRLYQRALATGTVTQLGSTGSSSGTAWQAVAVTGSFTIDTTANAYLVEVSNSSASGVYSFAGLKITYNAADARKTV